MIHTGTVTGLGLLALMALSCADDKPNSAAETSADASASEPTTDDAEDSNDTGGSDDSEQSAAPTNDSREGDTTNSDTTDGDTTEQSVASASDNETSNDVTETSADTADDTTSEDTTADGSESDDTTNPPPGDGPRIGNCPIFPADNAWNTDISDAPLHANSDAFIDSIGRDRNLHPDFGTEWEGAPIGIPYSIVNSSQTHVNINYTAYGDESDPGPMPIPEAAPIEGGADGDGDRHTLVLDEDSCTLYELYRAFPTSDGFDAESGTVWDLSRNEDHPEGCTSADAAGLPIFPGLVRYDEVVEQGEVLHALRFTVSQSQRGYIYPARHYASSNTDTNLAPMGLRVRMKANYDCGGYSTEARVLCTAMKRFGMIVADNGSNWYVSGAPDARWSDDNVGDLKDIPGDAFEVVDTGPVVTDSPDCSL